MTLDGSTLQKKARTYEALRVVLASVIAFTVVFTAGVLIVQSAQLREVGRINKANTALLVECTTPPADRHPPASLPDDDDCYLRSLRQSGKAVADLSTISIAAAACGAANPGDIPATRKCVEAALNKGGSK